MLLICHVTFFKFAFVSIYYFTFYFSSNWGTESDPEFKGYHNGNSDPRGFGKF